MELGISLTYSDLFDGPVPELEDLLQGVPSSRVITILSVINAQLYLDQDQQLKLLGFILQHQPTHVIDDITRRIATAQVTRGTTSVGIFSILYGLEFLHYELTHYRDVTSPENPQEELAFFKAYLVLSKNVTEGRTAGVGNQARDADHFQMQLWPIIIDQFLINQPLNPVTEIPKSIALLNFLEFHSNNEAYVKTFLNFQQKASSWNYILDVATLITSGWQSNSEKRSVLYPFAIKITPDFKSLFENFTMDVTIYNTKYGALKSSYTGLKERPLFKMGGDHLAVMNWNFLATKIYEGLLFDFHNLSGIKEKFEKFVPFKKFISEKFIEGFLFRRIIESLFNDTQTIVHFDDNGITGFPDAYVRRGKYIFLFEIKDALFPSEAIDSRSYEAIKKVVNDKYNNTNKGTGQFIKQLKHLESGSFEEKSFDELRLKKRNLVIYPVMIYTDRHFGMPGFNRYLMTEFSNKLLQSNLNESFGAIRPITFIDLSFLLNNIDILQTPQSSLKESLEVYHNTHAAATKRFQKDINVKNSLRINETFETVFAKKFRSQVDRKNRNYIEMIVSVLGLTNFLPKE